MASQPEIKKPSAASRYLFLFLIGLVVGAVCTVMAMRALQARQDPFPHAVMHVMAKHSGQLSDKVKQNRCAATDTIPGDRQRPGGRFPGPGRRLALQDPHQPVPGRPRRRPECTADRLRRCRRGGGEDRHGLQGLPSGLPRLTDGRRLNRN
jgi:hypothetical protein